MPLKHSIILLFAIYFIFSFPNLTGSNADCEVINYSEKINVDENGLNLEISCLIQVNNTSGEKYTKLSIPFDNKHKIKSLNAWIEDISGNIIRKIKNSEIIQSSAISEGTFYSDIFIKSFQLKHNIYPYRIRISFTYIYDQYLEIADFSPVIDPSVPVLDANLTVEVPIGFDIRYMNKNVNNPEIRTNEETITYIWKASYTGQLKKEAYSPPLDDFLPYVSVVPVNFKYEINGSFKTWNDYGNWNYRLNEGLDILTPHEEEKIANLIKGVTDDHEKVRLLYHYMQDNTRYIGVQIDIGGLKTYPAQYVCENKYGDCKALANYMKSLLKYAGINSNCIVVYADENPPEFDTNYVHQLFNHVILRVPLKNDTIWIECTNNSLPANYLGTSTQGRFALVTDKEKSSLVKTPSLTRSDVLNERRITYKITFDGSTHADLSIKARGSLFEDLLDVKRYLNAYEQDQKVKSIIKFPSFNLEKWNIDQPHRDSSFLYLNADLKILNFTKHYGNDIIVKALSANLPDFEPPSKRKLPVCINYPISQSDSIIVDIPETYSINSLPENQKFNSEYGQYETSVKAEKNRIIICRKYTINSGYYPISNYISFYEFISTLNRLEKENVLVFNE
jgi:transglutaminase-like putative cysteine protease